MVVDGNGEGMVVGYAIVRAETQAILLNLLRLFQGHNEGNPDIIMLDKSMSEIASAKSIYPSSNIILCRFHVIGAMKVRISALDNIDTGEKILH